MDRRNIIIIISMIRMCEVGFCEVGRYWVRFSMEYAKIMGERTCFECGFVVF